MTKRTTRGWREWVSKRECDIDKRAAGFTPAPARPATIFRWHAPPAAVRSARNSAARCRRQAAGTAPEGGRCALVIPRARLSAKRSMAKIEAANALKTVGRPPAGIWPGPSERPPLEAQKHLEKMTADLKRVKELREVRTAGWQQTSQAKAAVETGCATAAARRAVARPRWTGAAEAAQGRNALLDAIENRRRRGREIRALIHTIRSCCFPKSYCKQRAREQIDVLAERGAVSVSRLVELDGDIEFPTQLLRAMVHSAAPGAVVRHVTVDVVGLIAWLHGDLLIKRHRCRNRRRRRRRERADAPTEATARGRSAAGLAYL